MSEKFQAISDKVSENFCLAVTLHSFCSTKKFFAMLFSKKLKTNCCHCQHWHLL